MSSPNLHAEIEIEGYNAYMNGASEDDNPYYYRTRAYEDWLVGWDRAYSDSTLVRESDERDRKMLMRRL